MRKAMILLHCGPRCQYYGDCFDGYPESVRSKEKFCSKQSKRISVLEQTEMDFPEWCPLPTWKYLEE